MFKPVLHKITTSQQTLIFCLAAILIFISASILLAESGISSNKVMEKGDWSVFAEGNPRECWAVSQPRVSMNTKNGKVVAFRRDDILLFVSFRPKDNLVADVAFTPGYALKKSELKIQNEVFHLNVKGHWAWLETSKLNSIVASKIASGSKVVITSTSRKGIVTQDTFSLKGSRAAIEAAAKECDADVFHITRSKISKKEPQIQTVQKQESTSNCLENVQVCPIKDLCDIATFSENGLKTWSSVAATQKHVNFAKKNGLDCGIKEARKPSELRRVASGTGFFVNKSGHIVTNFHVISGCNQMRSGENELKVIAEDPRNDLAILKTTNSPKTYFKLSGKKPQILEPIIAAGYPFGDALSSSIKVTKGIISSLVGLENNANELQIDAALQPGNSGGPIINEAGNLVAVAVARLDASFALENFGVLPENTNFGIKVSALRSLLDARSVKYEEASGSSVEALGDLVTSGTVFLTCWMNEDRIKEMQANKVMFKSVTK
jgi:S1-C subfamily serine protease